MAQGANGQTIFRRRGILLMKVNEDRLILNESEKELLTKLLNNRCSLSEGLQLYNQLTGRGIAFRMEWEEKIIELALVEEPNRLDLLTRYRQLLLASGRQVPADIELRYVDVARTEEYSMDHQRSADHYNVNAKMNDTEPEFRSLVERVRVFTMTSVERMYALYKSVEYIQQAQIPGDIVECGVWRGGSMMLVALTLLSLGHRDRDLFLFDTYQGLPAPDESKDVDLWGNRAIDGWLGRQTSAEGSHWAEAGLEDVRANLQATGYPHDRIHFVKGMVEQTIPDYAPENIALLRLDTDWYASTNHEMENLFPRLSSNGVLIIDDYGHFKGARQAVDDYMADHGLALLLNRIDYTGRLVIKTC